MKPLNLQKVKETLQKNIEFFKCTNRIKEFIDIIEKYTDVDDIGTIKYKIIDEKGINVEIRKNGKTLYPTDKNGFSYMEQLSDATADEPIINDMWERLTMYEIEKHKDKKPIRTQVFFNTIVELEEFIENTPEYKETGVYYDEGEMPTLAFMGIGAGLHIEKIIDKSNIINSVLMYEPNEELFALSCYFLDYEKLHKKVGEDKLLIIVNGDFEKHHAIQFLSQRKAISSILLSLFVAYESPELDKAKMILAETILISTYGWGFYIDERIGLKNFFNNVRKDIPTLYKTKKTKCPICVVANGSSLDNDIEWLKQNQDNFIIISAGTAIRPLLSAGIHSDFHVEVERLDELVDEIKDDIKKNKGYFIGASVINSKHFDNAKKSLMFVKDASIPHNLSEYSLPFTTPTVGNAVFSIAISFSNEIYLVGNDVGFKKNKKIHAKNSYYDELEDTKKDSKDVRKVKGNFSDDIYTEQLFDTIKYNIERAIKDNPDAKVINMSDGAYIEGTIIKRSEEINNLSKVNKEKYIEKIIECFDKFEGVYYLNVPYRLKIMVEDFIKIIDVNISNRKDLMDVIANIEKYIRDTEKNEKLFTLIKGTILTTTFYMYNLLHKTDIKYYKNIVEKIKKGFKKMLEDCEKNLKF